jgi:peptide/nickel transport system ATP-binding protein/oligopeptide transport system ATP-binding protein
VSRPLLSARDLKLTYRTTAGLIRRKTIASTRAVDGVSFDIYPGETVGLVGGSGSGKSTLARIISRLIEPDSGEVWFDGELITQVSADRMRLFRRDIQVVFQDPLHSLNPRRTVSESIARPLLNFSVPKKVALARAESLLSLVGLDPAVGSRYPHEFSGGQCQRIAIARALALEPRLLILDEPVSALDVSVQAQILNLLKELQSQLGIAFLFVSHDLGIIRYMCDRTLVMYRGQILESGASGDIHSLPSHPFTRNFLDTILTMDGDQRWLQVAANAEDLEEGRAGTGGCVYHATCMHRLPVCQTTTPELQMISSDRAVACHLYDEETGFSPSDLNAKYGVSP